MTTSKTRTRAKPASAPASTARASHTTITKVTSPSTQA